MTKTSLAETAHRTVCCTGVVLVNLGTPNAATPTAIRSYLAQFLSDPRVVEVPRLLWWPILHAFILPLRPRRLAHAYGQIWSGEGSPLMVISRRQTDAIAHRLQQPHSREVAVELAMSYGDPTIPSALERLRARGAQHIVILPLFPQYSGSTTGAVLDAVFSALRGQRWLPELRTINSYHDDPGYIAALAASIEAHWQRSGRSQHLLLSFHGVPRRYVLAGDPYYCHCQKTARLLAERLTLRPEQYSVTFQSRFGRAPWVQPYTDERIRALGASGLETLDVLCPGFAADCLETLEEVSLRYKAEFLNAGGRAFHYIPALNADAAHIQALTDIIERNLAGWQTSGASAADQDVRLRRAAALQPSFFGGPDPDRQQSPSTTP